MTYKSIINIIKNYHWQSLFFKYWKLLILTFAIPVVIFFFIFTNMFSKIQNHEITQSFITSAYKSREVLNIAKNDFENYYNSLISYENTINFLNSDNPAAKGINNYQMQLSLTDDFKAFKSNHLYIDSIFIYSAKSDYVISTRTNNSLSKHLYGNMIKQCLSSDAFYSGISTIENQPCITLAYPIKHEDYNIVSGSLIININCTKLAEHIAEGNSAEKVLIFNSDYGLLNSPSKEIGAAATFYNNIYLENTENIQNSEYYIERAEETMACYIPIEDFNITFALLNTTDATNKIISSIAKSLIFFIIISLFAVIVLSFFTSLSIYKSIANIISEIGISQIPGNANTNETEIISNHFLSMLKNKSEIEDELSNKIELLKQSQTLALQTQINPHFIFNTLNLVNLMIIRITKQNCAPARIISLLSDVIHYSLETDKFITTLDNELHYTHKYIQIEQIKNNNSFSFDFDIDESTKNCALVKFTLQPILENCIEHGFKKNKQHDGLIKVKTYIRNNILYIRISDNGIGITPEQFEKITDNLNSSDVISSGKHIGLPNVNQRIQLIWGNEYGVKILPQKQGLTIEISQPVTHIS